MLFDQISRQWVVLLLPIFWPFLRLLAVFSVAPIFSSKAFPVRIRVVMALLVAWAASGTIPSSELIGLDSPLTVGAVFHEVMVGLSIGFTLRLAFAAAELAGELMGLQIGLNFAGFFNPGSNLQASALAIFIGHLVALLFIVVDGHLLLLMAIIKSYEVMPHGQGGFEMIRQWRIHEMGGFIFASAFWMALPMTVLLILTNMALGVMSRVAPQMNIFAIGFPITVSVGLGGLAILLPFMERSLLDIFAQSLDRIGVNLPQIVR